MASPFGLFLFCLYRWIYQLNQKAVRQQLQPRQANLQRIVANLESDGTGDASEVDELVELVSSLSPTDPSADMSSGWSTWSENWNRIVPSWWIVAMILVLAALYLARLLGDRWRQPERLARVMAE